MFSSLQYLQYFLQSDLKLIQPIFIAIKINEMMLERFQSEPRQLQHLKSKLYCKAAATNKLTIIEVIYILHLHML